MAKAETIIKFDGPALSGKSMDVAHLAPSLLALSDLLKDINYQSNGNRAGVRVFVNADLEQNCFELVVEIATSAWETAKILIADDRVKTAKEIAELAGIIGGPIFGLYHLIKWLRGKKIESVTVVKVSDGKNVVEIKVEGDPNIKEISQSVYELYANVSTRKKALDVLSPLREEGYETLEFYDDGGVFVHFDENDVPQADFSDLPEVIPQNENKSIIRTGVRIRKAAYEGASKWTLMYKRAIEASIDDTGWLARFQSGEEKAPPGSSLDIDLEEIFITNENGEMIGEPSYRVLKVHDVALPERQKTLRFTGLPEDS